MKKQKDSLNVKNVSLAFALLLVLQTGFLALLWQENRSTKDTLSIFVDAQTRSEADIFEVQPIVDAESKRLYLPGLSLYFPLTPDAMDLTYRVSDADGGGTTDLVFLSRLNNRVSMGGKASECRDLVRVEIGAKEPQPRENETAQEPFVLADGRQVYTYLPNSERKCEEGFVKPQEVNSIVRQMQSY